MEISDRIKLIVVLLLLLVGRVAISGSGMLDDSDEVDYYAAEDAVDSLLVGNLAGSINALVLTEGKPTETLLKMALVPVHRAWALIIGVPRHSVSGLLPLSAFNIIVSLGLLLAFHRLLLTLALGEGSALLGMMILGVTVNLNLYTRHLLPYDLGLLFNMLALLALLHRPWEMDRRVRSAAILSALGFTTYHGHFMFTAILCGLVVLPADPRNRWNWQRLRSFALWFVALPVAYELLFRLGGQSFFKEAFKIGGTISQGSFDEGFRYAWLYASLVEGPLGMALVALFPVSVLAALRKDPDAKVTRILVLASIAYLSYALVVQCLNLFVFYGRILHMYLPFLVLGVSFLIDRLPQLRSRLVLLALVLFVTIQYVSNVLDMNSIAYPRKVLDTYGLSADRVGISFHHELSFTEDHVSNPRFRKHGQRPGELTGDSLVVVNTAFFHHHPDRFIDTHRPFAADGGDTLFSGLHFMSHPAYTLEYCSRMGREFYLSQQFHITVIRP
jgi:hypothetical protein